MQGQRLARYQTAGRIFLPLARDMALHNSRRVKTRRSEAMIEKTPQGPSPVTSPRISAPGNVFSGVRSATVDRLQHTVRNHNGIPNNIAMGRAPKPVASASNEMAVRVTDFEPKPGLQPRLGMHMQVQNAPGSKVDAVADAIQRYLNIKPRREPTSDPLAEDSIARHPQQIIEGASRWDTAQTYQFAINGAKSYQFQPEIHRWGGSLSADLVEPGLTGVAAPATREPQPGYHSTPATGSEEVVFAAQNAMRNLRFEFDKKISGPFVTTGAPNITGDPYFDPAFAAQNTMARLRELAESPNTEFVKVGAGGYSDQDYNNPAIAYENAVSRLEDNLAQAVALPGVTVGAGGYSDQPGNQPPVALAASIDRIHERLLGQGPLAADDYEAPTLAAQKSVGDIMENMAGPPKPEIITVGEGDMFQSIHWQPRQAWISGTHESVNLAAAPGGNLKEAQKTALNQAWLRAMHIMRQNENFNLATQVLGRQA